MKQMMKNFFSKIFNFDSLAAWWIPAVLLILIFSLSSCGKEVEERTSEQIIEDCIENEGYDDVFDYLHQSYSFNEVFNEMVDTYGSERITDEVIANGWAKENVGEEQADISRDLSGSALNVLPTAEPSYQITKYRSSGTASSYTPSWSSSASSSVTRSGTGTTSSEKQDTTVYVTNTGSKYHKSGCQYLKESKIPISLSDAKARGYTPCSKCY